MLNVLGREKSVGVSRASDNFSFGHNQIVTGALCFVKIIFSCHHSL